MAGGDGRRAPEDFAQQRPEPVMKPAPKGLIVLVVRDHAPPGPLRDYFVMGIPSSYEAC